MAERPMEHEQLAVVSSGAETLEVDSENRVVKGFVVAQLGGFKTKGRGEFDERALRAIERLMKSDPAGLPSYFGHAKPGESPHQLGKFLGRGKNPRIEEISVTRNGARVKVPAVLADLHLDASAFDDNPNGNIGGYVMKLAKSDPRAFGSSLVVDAAKEYRLNRGRAVVDETTGEPLPPLWRPLRLASIDVVGEGEAVDSFLPSRLSTDEAIERLSDDPEHKPEALEAEPADAPTIEPSADGDALDLYLVTEGD